MKQLTKMLLFLAVLNSVMHLAMARVECSETGYCLDGETCCNYDGDSFQCCVWSWYSQWYIWVAVVFSLSLLSIFLRIMRRRSIRAACAKRSAQRSAPQRMPVSTTISTTTTTNAPQNYNQGNVANYGQVNAGYVQNPYAPNMYMTQQPQQNIPSGQMGYPPPYPANNAQIDHSRFEPDGDRLVK